MNMPVDRTNRNRIAKIKGLHYNVIATSITEIRTNRQPLATKSAQKKAKSKVAEAEMFVMRNRY